MPIIPYAVRYRLEVALVWVLWLMADIPVGEGPRIKYSGQITLGNISTIISGLIVAASILWSISQYAESLKSGLDRLGLRIDGVVSHVDQLECSLAAKGTIDSTTVPCTFKGNHDR